MNTNYSQFISRKYILLISLSFCISVAVSQTNVQFRVNMNYQTDQGKFDPETEFVDLAGSFNDWGGGIDILFSDDNDDGIYTVSVALTIGANIEFKARINGEWNGREEFPGGGPNRTYTVVENGIVEFWYNDEVPAGALDVRISSSGSVIRPGDKIQFIDESSGSPVEWDWSFPGGNPATSSDQNPVITYSTSGSYSVSLTITNSGAESASKTFSYYVLVDNMETPWWNDAVFYEIFVRSYKDSDGDGIGDFTGLINNLDYLNDGDPSTDTDLGITGIWLMPVMEAPSYHGYDISDYRTIEQDYGTNDQFKTFIQEAHNRGIKVIVDFVMNHTSTQMDWFVESTSPGSAKRDWYVWESSDPGFTGPWGQQVWHGYGGYYYYGLFWGGMPDLNYASTAAKNEMFDVARFWLEEMGADGFRLDAVRYIFEDGEMMEDTDETFQFWKDFRAYYKSVDSDAFAVGEAWGSTDLARKYVIDDGIDYCFEFEMAGNIITTTNSGNASVLSGHVEKVMRSYPYTQFGSFLTNHDMNRLMSQLGSDYSKAKLAASLLLTLPGVPYLYYGEEIGMTGVKPDEYIRTPLQWNSSTHAGFTTGTPWQPVNADYTTKNIEAQQADMNSLWQHYRKLIEIRNNEDPLKKGTYKNINSSGSVYAFLRQYGNLNVIVVSNPGTSTASGITLDLSYAGIPTGSYTMTELQGGSDLSITVDGTGGFSGLTIAEIPGRTTLIYKIEGLTNVRESKEVKNSAILFPSVTSDMINLKISGSFVGSADIQILDLSGRIHKSTSLYHSRSGQQHKIAVNDLQNGFYLLVLNTGSANEVFRFVVKH